MDFYHDITIFYDRELGDLEQRIRFGLCKATRIPSNEHASCQNFLLALRPDIQLLSKQNVPNMPDCMLCKADTDGSAES